MRKVLVTGGSRGIGKAIVKKCEELYNLAVEKGTPVLEKAADDIRLTAIDVLNSITEK